MQICQKYDLGQVPLCKYSNNGCLIAMLKTYLANNIQVYRSEKLVLPARVPEVLCWGERYLSDRRIY